MAKFTYIATTAEGARVSGATQAKTMAEARVALTTKELQVLEIREKKSRRPFQRTKVPPQEIMHFSRQLAAFIRSGVPILEGIQIIQEEAGNAILRGALYDIAEDLQRGQSLSSAVQQHNRLFPRFYVDMLRAAELTGRLDNVLDQLSKYIERDLEARQKIRSALAYPIVIFFFSVVTVVIMATFVLPRFKTFFESLDAELPLSTRILLGFTGFLTEWWWAVIAGIVLLAILLRLVLRTTWGRIRKDRLLLRLPVIGEVIRYAIIERFCRILSSMVVAGVPLPEAMEVVAEGTKNSLYEDGLLRVRQEMLEGQGISRPLGSSGLFPNSVVQMIRVGEETGTLEEQLTMAGNFYEQELGYKIKKLTSLFEPAVIAVMGLMVGFVAVSVVSAIYGIFKQTEGF